MSISRAKGLILGSLFRYEGSWDSRDTNPFYDKKQGKVCALNRSMSVLPKAILQTHTHKRTHTQSLVALQDTFFFF